MADLAIRQGDTLPAMATTILDPYDGVFDLTDCSVMFVLRAMNASAPIVHRAATIIAARAGTVEYSWQAGDTATTGIFAAVFIITTGDGGTYTYPNDGYLEVSVEENLTTSGGATLVSLGEAKDYLNFQASDKTRDAKLLRFIRSIQPSIEFLTGPILPQQFEEWHDGGQTFIILRRRPSTTYATSPILSVQAISEYSGPIEWPLSIVGSPDEGQLYSVQVEPRLGRIVRRTSGGGVQPFPNMPQSVHVWYTAGQSAVPDNVKEGTLELIRLHFQQTQQGRPRIGGAAAADSDEAPDKPFIGFFIPGKVRELLAPNRRAPAVA